jgi:glutamine synthetase
MDTGPVGYVGKGASEHCSTAMAVQEFLQQHTVRCVQRAQIGLLPQNLLEALEALQGDSVVCAALGESLAQEFIALKRMEWREYAHHVSDWETRRYLELF